MLNEAGLWDDNKCTHFQFPNDIRADYCFPKTCRSRKHTVLVVEQSLRCLLLPLAEFAFELDLEPLTFVSTIIERADTTMLTGKPHELLLATSREHNALLVFLAAPHDSVLAVNRLVHRLRAVKLRVAECSQASNQVLRFLGNTPFVHVKHVCFYHVNRLRKVLRRRPFNLVRESRRQKTFRIHPLMDRVLCKCKLPQRSVNSRACNFSSKTGGNLGDGGQEPPLIGKCYEIVVNKNRVRLPLRLPLKWQRNQVAKTTLGNGGLRREEPIVRPKAHSRCLRHRVGDKRTSEIARKLGIDRLLEEKPDMRAVSRS